MPACSVLRYGYWSQSQEISLARNVCLSNWSREEDTASGFKESIEEKDSPPQTTVLSAKFTFWKVCTCFCFISLLASFLIYVFVAIAGMYPSLYIYDMISFLLISSSMYIDPGTTHLRFLTQYVDIWPTEFHWNCECSFPLMFSLSGQPSPDPTNPDYGPSLHLGHDSQTDLWARFECHTSPLK